MFSLIYDPYWRQPLFSIHLSSLSYPCFLFHFLAAMSFLFMSSTGCPSLPLLTFSPIEVCFQITINYCTAFYNSNLFQKESWCLNSAIVYFTSKLLSGVFQEWHLLIIIILFFKFSFCRLRVQAGPSDVNHLLSCENWRASQRMQVPSYYAWVEGGKSRLMPTSCQRARVLQKGFDTCTLWFTVWRLIH